MSDVKKEKRVFFCLVMAFFVVFGFFHSFQGRVARADTESLATESFLKEFVSAEKYSDPQPFPSMVFYDFDDKKHDEGILSDGRYLLVNFWAVWCPQCIIELPSLQKLKELRGGTKFDVVFVSMDFPHNAAFLKDSMKQFKVPDIDTYYLQDTGIWNKLPLNTVPVSFLVGPAGRILYIFTGDTDWASPGSLAFIDTILGQ